MYTLLVLLGVGEASAFCGTYVGSAEAPVNERSEVVMVRAADRTSLTLRNDYSGPREDFAMVIPVPEVIPQDRVNVVDPYVFDALDAYSAPRLVSYQCSDFESDTDTDSDTDSDTDTDTDYDVDVEAQYIVGEYDVVVLSAEQSSDLFGWLSANGYLLPESSVPLLQEYIDAGSYFLAAKVAAEDLPNDVMFSPAELSPLQLRYRSDTFTLPIRIGTLNSPGEQDLVVHLITDGQQGSVGIANYPETTLENDCIWLREGQETFGQFYEAQFDAAFEAAGGEAAWTLEYAWPASSCDPCPTTPPDATTLYTLGFMLEPHRAFVTRIRARYTAEAATEDLVFYPTNSIQTHQMRYITGDSECYDAPYCDGRVPNTDDESLAKRGCNGTGSQPMGWFVAVLLAFGIRKRR